MKTIEQIISEYEDLYLQMQDLQKEAERLKDWAIPQEVKDMLAEIDKVAWLWHGMRNIWND